jgi:hypothetical protein
VAKDQIVIDTQNKGDDFWVMCESLIENDYQQRFKHFLNKNPSNAWFISSDYVIADSSRPNDCMCFTIYPIDGQDPLAIWREIPSVLPKDFKKTRGLSEEPIAFLKQDCHFSVCIILTKERYTGNHRELVRAAIEQLLAGMCAWKDADRQQEYIARVRRLARSATANNFKAGLMRDIFLVTAAAAVIAYLLTKWTHPRLIGWFSDRDDLIAAYDRIAADLFIINYGSICQHRWVDFQDVQLRNGNPRPDPRFPKQSWYDAIVRIPDYLAGTLAAYNFRDNTTLGQQKVFDMIREVLPNALNLIIVAFERHGNLMVPNYVEIKRITQRG